jgi:flagellar motility protein MotE (MotC chaperone)
VIRGRAAWSGLLGILLAAGGAVVTVMAETQPPADSKFGEKPAEPTRSDAQGSAEPLAPQAGTCQAEAAVLDELRARRSELEARQKAMDAREADLAAREKALDEELKRVAQVRDEITRLEGANKKDHEEKVAKLVETLETMSPKAASQMVAQLDEGLAVAAIARMSTPRLAKILNVMEPAKSSRLTETMAGVIRAARGERAARPGAGSGAAAHGTPVAKAGFESHRKGGEKAYDGKPQEQSEQPDEQQPKSVPDVAAGPAQPGRSPGSER